MPKRKTLPKIPDYEGMGNDFENHKIEKSKSLQSLAQTDLTLPELKILDLYLARIDSHKPDKRTVRLEKGELEKALGVTRILKDELDKRLRHLFQIVEVKDKHKRKGFKLICLFEEADAEPDDNGLWQITLTCTASAREYVFNIDNVGYLQYRLKNVINLTSRYSYVLFLYLYDNRYRKKWKIDLDELKTMMNCNAERYQQFKFFNAEILKKCQKEICGKTDLCYEYSTEKRGRSIVAIEFSIISIKEQLKNEVLALDKMGADGEFVGQTSLFDVTPANTDEQQDYGSPELNAYAAACGNSFTADDLKIIEAALDMHTETLSTLDERVNWLRTLYAKLTVEELDKTRKPIKNRIKYLIAMIKKEKPPKKEEQHEPSYNMGEWEGMALSFDPSMVKKEDD